MLPSLSTMVHVNDTIMDYDDDLNNESWSEIDLTSGGGGGGDNDNNNNWRQQNNTNSNSSSSNKINCTNDYCISDEEYIDMIADYLKPSIYGWLLIVLHTIVFFGGIIGNLLVCIAVYRNHSMRTVTNYFITNLAVADILVILFCLPPTVLWDVTETWFFGERMCKIILYVQVSRYCIIKAIY